jgi:hypothetical protein
LLHGNVDPDEYQQRRHEELVLCNSVGKFERFGEGDIAFVCDYCDGYMVWEDLESMPSVRTVDEAIALRSNRTSVIAGTPMTSGPAPLFLRRSSTGLTSQQQQQPPTPPPAGIAHWQATGFTASTHEEKSVVFAPLAIANHLAPENGEWQSRLLCPFCDDDYAIAQGQEGNTTADDEDAVRWTQDERGYEDLNGFREHLEWQHTPLPVPSIPLSSATSERCVVM